MAPPELAADGSQLPASTSIESDVISAIRGRHSVRHGYSTEPLDPAVIDALLACGEAAPSSKNARPWRFHVVTDRALLRKAADAARSAPDGASYVPHDPATGRPRPEYTSTVEESCDVLAAVPCAFFIENRGPFSEGHEHLAGADAQARAVALNKGAELTG